MAIATGGPEALKPVGETEFVAALAREADARGAKARVCEGIVGLADMLLGDAVAPVLEAHIAAGEGRFRGIRHVTARNEAFRASIVPPPPAQVMADPVFRQAYARLREHGLSFDAWLYHTQIDELADLARAFPDTPVILNHVGGPLGIGPFAGKRDEVFPAWRAAVGRLAVCPNASVKLGGLAMVVTGFEFHKQAEPPGSEQLLAAWRPYLETCIEAFGPARCMFESNFPVDKAMCSYTAMWNAFKRSARALGRRPRGDVPRHRGAGLSPEKLIATNNGRNRHMAVHHTPNGAAARALLPGSARADPCADQFGADPDRAAERCRRTLQGRGRPGQQGSRPRWRRRISAGRCSAGRCRSCRSTTRTRPTWPARRPAVDR